MVFFLMLGALYINYAVLTPEFMEGSEPIHTIDSRIVQTQNVDDSASPKP